MKKFFRDSALFLLFIGLLGLSYLSAQMVHLLYLEPRYSVGLLLVTITSCSWTIAGWLFLIHEALFK